jgi:broad-specificity NMP kinase
MKYNNETMKLILAELKEQCLKVADLIDSYDLENKSEDEKDDMIVDMSVHLSVLATRSTLIDGYFEEMLEDEAVAVGANTN